MAPKPQDTHQSECPMIGIIRKPYLPYISSILQDREISDKLAKLVENYSSVTSMARETTLTKYF